jgi:hypothetical protein
MPDFFPMLFGDVVRGFWAGGSEFEDEVLACANVGLVETDCCLVGHDVCFRDFIDSEFWLFWWD